MISMNIIKEKFEKYEKSEPDYAPSCLGVRENEIPI